MHLQMIKHETRVKLVMRESALIFEVFLMDIIRPLRFTVQFRGHTFLSCTMNLDSKLRKHAFFKLYYESQKVLVLERIQIQNYYVIKDCV